MPCEKILQNPLCVPFKSLRKAVSSKGVFQKWIHENLFSRLFQEALRSYKGFMFPKSKTDLKEDDVFK
jgi:hypothetical protein